MSSGLAAKLGYRTIEHTATRAKFSALRAVKFSLDTRNARIMRLRRTSRATTSRVGHARRCDHGPQIANVIPGRCTFTNSVLPSGEKHAPASSFSAGCALRAMR